MKIWKRKGFWWALLCIGCLPYLACLWTGIDAAFTGISFLWSAPDYGWEGFLTAIVVWSYLFWPAYLVGLMLIMISAFALICMKDA